MFLKIGETASLAIEVKNDNLPVVDDIILAKIKNIKNNNFFNGLFWVSEECTIFVNHKENGIYELLFTPDEVSTYEATMYSKNYPVAMSKTIYCFEEGTEDSLVPIDSKTFKNQDGSDTKIVNQSGVPITGAKITCFNLSGEVEAVTQSNDTGDWNMLIKRGRYFFSFEKDGFVSVSFERTVV